MLSLFPRRQAFPAAIRRYRRTSMNTNLNTPFISIAYRRCGRSVLAARPVVALSSCFSLIPKCQNRKSALSKPKNAKNPAKRRGRNPITDYGIGMVLTFPKVKSFPERRAWGNRFGDGIHHYSIVFKSHFSNLHYFLLLRWRVVQLPTSPNWPNLRGWLLWSGQVR